QLGARGVDLGAHVGQGAVLVEGNVELHDDDAGALIGAAGHLFQSLNRAEVVLHRLHQKPLAVLRTDARIIYLHNDVRYWDIWIGFLRNHDECQYASDDRHNESRDHQPRILDRPIDDFGHARAPAGIAFTREPSATNSCPTVMTVVAFGRPLTHMPSGPSETIFTGLKWTMPLSTVRTPTTPLSFSTRMPGEIFIACTCFTGIWMSAL